MDVAENVTTGPSAFDGARIYYATGDVEGASLLEGMPVTYNERPSRANLVAKPSDVLFAKMQATNKVVLVNGTGADALFSTGFFNLRPRAGKLDARYLFWFLQSELFRLAKDRRCTGATQKALTLSGLKEIRIPLPDEFDDQSRIADFLDRADGMARKAGQALILAESLPRAAFLSMFGDPVLNPKSLAKVPLGDVFSVSSGNALTARNMDPTGQYPVYGGNGISGYHSEYMFEEPQVVIGRVGAYCGAIHISKPRSWITDNALYVKHYKKPIDKVYLEWALRFADLNKYAGRAAQPLVSGGRIYPVEILFPDAHAQQAFATVVQRQEAIRQKLAASLAETRSVFGSLELRAFKGEL